MPPYQISRADFLWTHDTSSFWRSSSDCLSKSCKFIVSMMPVLQHQIGLSGSQPRLAAIERLMIANDRALCVELITSEGPDV